MMPRLHGMRGCAALAFVAAAALSDGWAQPAETPSAGAAAPAAANPIVAAPGREAPDTPSPATPFRRQRSISPEVAAQLKAATPKYTPPPPKREEAETVDMREVDKPRNGIIRLPPVIVRDKPPPVLNERTVSTQAGLEALARKRFINTEADRALNAYRLPLVAPLGGEPVEMTMYREDERLRNMNDLNATAEMVSESDRAAGAYVKRQIDDTFNRPGQFDWRPAWKR